MTTRKSSFAAGLIAGWITLLTAGMAAAQKPDLSGVWQGPYVPDMTRTARNQTGEANLPFTPAGEKDWKSYDAANGDYTGSCLPFGLSRSVNAPNPFAKWTVDIALRRVRMESNTLMRLARVMVRLRVT